MKPKKRGPKPKPASEKKVKVGFWVKQKHKQLAEIDIAKLELKFEDEKLCDKESSRIGNPK